MDIKEQMRIEAKFALRVIRVITEADKADQVKTACEGKGLTRTRVEIDGIKRIHKAQTALEDAVRILGYEGPDY